MPLRELRENNLRTKRLCKDWPTKIQYKWLIREYSKPSKLLSSLHFKQTSRTRHLKKPISYDFHVTWLNICISALKHDKSTQLLFLSDQRQFQENYSVNFT